MLIRSSHDSRSQRHAQIRIPRATTQVVRVRRLWSHIPGQQQVPATRKGKRMPV